MMEATQKMENGSGRVVPIPITGREIVRYQPGRPLPEEQQQARAGFEALRARANDAEATEEERQKAADELATLPDPPAPEQDLFDGDEFRADRLVYRLRCPMRLYVIKFTATLEKLAARVTAADALLELRAFVESDDQFDEAQRASFLRLLDTYDSVPKDPVTEAPVEKDDPDVKRLQSNVVRLENIAARRSELYRELLAAKHTFQKMMLYTALEFFLEGWEVWDPNAADGAGAWVPDDTFEARGGRATERTLSRIDERDYTAVAVQSLRLMRPTEEQRKN